MANIEWTDNFEQRLRQKLEEDYEQADRMVVWASHADKPLRRAASSTPKALPTAWLNGLERNLDYD